MYPMQTHYLFFYPRLLPAVVRGAAGDAPAPGSPALRPDHPGPGDDLRRPPGPAPGHQRPPAPRGLRGRSHLFPAGWVGAVCLNPEGPGPAREKRVGRSRPRANRGDLTSCTSLSSIHSLLHMAQAHTSYTLLHTPGTHRCQSTIHLAHIWHTHLHTQFASHTPHTQYHFVHFQATHAHICKHTGSSVLSLLLRRLQRGGELGLMVTVSGGNLLRQGKGTDCDINSDPLLSIVSRPWQARSLFSLQLCWVILSY